MEDLAQRLEAALAGRYAIERVLGAGGMAVVYLARDRKHGDRAVALKVLRPEFAAALGPERFLREIRIAAHLNHPHIVPVFDSGEAGGLLYYVMPCVEGETLRQRMRRESALSHAEAARIVSDVAAGLAHAHAHGVVHRDVKPENIMLPGGEAVVTDFGIARAVRVATDESLTGAGFSLGTVGYMSPEQAAGSAELDGRSDVYSLACVAYELVAGDALRRWLTPETLRAGRIECAPPPARDRLDTLPAGVEAAVVRALAPLPDDRYGTALEFAAAFAAGDPKARAVTRRSVAVLPFECLGGGVEEVYLGDGLAEEITGALARIRALRVASRTSAFAYRGRRTDVREIARALGVGTILEGTIRRAGDTLRVAVQLVNAADGYQVWSARYERDLRDVFPMQDEIAQRVAEALAVVLSDDERRAIRRAPPVDASAHDYYLRGLHYFHQWRKKSLEYALQMFDRAIEADPGFALAHAGVADSCSVLHMYYPSSTADLARADEASRRALELGPELPEAHAARGFALFQLGRYDEAEVEFRIAMRLDPRQFEARYYFGRQCFQRGAFGEAARWFEEAAAVREDYPARFFAAQSYTAQDRPQQAEAAYRRALAVAERHIELHPDDPRAATMCAVSACRLGEAERGLAWAERALEIDPEDAGVRYNVACLYALEGQRERALDCLEEVARLGFANWEWVAKDPDLASLRDEPRFRALQPRA